MAVAPVDPVNGPDFSADLPRAQTTLIAALQRLAVSTLRLDLAPESLAPDAPFLGGALDLDSVDAAALLVAIEKHFDICFSVEELAQGPLSSLSELAATLARRGIAGDERR